MDQGKGSAVITSCWETLRQAG